MVNLPPQKEITVLPLGAGPRVINATRIMLGLGVQNTRGGELYFLNFRKILASKQ